jgi:hypothetical protein
LGYGAYGGELKQKVIFERVIRYRQREGNSSPASVLSA